MMRPDDTINRGVAAPSWLAPLTQHEKDRLFDRLEARLAAADAVTAVEAGSFTASALVRFPLVEVLS